MRRDEIVKALRCFASEDNCPLDECNEKCPYWMEIDKYDIDNPNAEISDVHQLCRAAADLLEQDAKKNRWISVKDKLPDEEEDVLLLVREVEHYGRHAEKRNVYHWVFTGWHVDDEWATTYCHGYKRIKEENKKSTYCEHTVTHWMPLPDIEGIEDET